MWAVFGIVAFAIWLVIVGGMRLAVGFTYTRRSTIGLFVCAAAAVLLASYVSFGVLDLTFPLNAVVSLALALVLFVGFGNVMIEFWVRRLLRQYDREIARLLQAEETERNKLESARDRMHSESLRQQALRDRQREMNERMNQLQSQIDSWQQGGGVARVRTLKVEEWRARFEAMEESQLARAREALKTAIAEAVGKNDEESVEHVRQLKAELAVLDMEVIRRYRPQEPPTTGVMDLVAEQDRVKRNIEDIERKIAEIRQQRAEFLRQKIRLE